MEYFYFKFKDTEHFKKGDVLFAGHGNSTMILKVYKNTWWRRALRFIGFKVRINECKFKQY